ncbi:unnamed protein product [Ophioblennius macclurei]
MAPLRFCANVSWLFTELPDVSQRLQAAAAAGFRSVEAAWLYDSDPQRLREARRAAGVEVVLINTPPGDPDRGELGLAAVPGREADFRQGLDLAVKYARALDCRKVHVMAGRVPLGAERNRVQGDMEDLFVQNLRYAADVLEKEGMMGLIEPINTRVTDPRYFLDSPHQAAAILDRVSRPNVRLQMDLFHWQIMDGNLTENMRRYLPLVGHVQVAQVPDRHEPDSPGELSYPYLFQTLERLGYRGHVGCEYRPRGATEEGLGWVRPYLD